ncbi:MAG TPA: 50S ribosomal protein L18 [Oligoflexia bacterium]|nr:50S ribosomal protein L18 [Oligoflexia bacterium]HMP26483.1 50S ribosomal protein L18 [Oligoflexia bacterium]
MKNTKKISSRIRRKVRIRQRLSQAKEHKPRISIFKSNMHTYAQIIDDLSGRTIVSASTLEKEVVDQISSLKEVVAKEKNQTDKSKVAESKKSMAAARAVGVVLAKRALAQNVHEVIFDRNGFIYAGRVKAIADGARDGGLKF